MPCRNAIVHKLIFVVQQRVRLGDDVTVFRIRREINRFVADKGQNRHRQHARLAPDGCAPLRSISVPAGIVLPPSRRSTSSRSVRPTRRWIVGRQLAVNTAVRRFDEAVFVHPPIARQTTDQADVRAFRRLNRADTSIVAVMHVAHIEAGTLTPQTARAQRRQRALVGQFRQRDWSVP